MASTAATSDNNASTGNNSSESNIVHPLFDGKYFKTKTKDGNKVKCICMLCNREVSAANNATTNLYTHLKVSLMPVHHVGDLLMIMNVVSWDILLYILCTYTYIRTIN